MKLFLLLLLPFILPSSSCAYAEETVNEGIDEIMEGLDFSAYNEFLEELEQQNPTSVQTIEQIIKDILNGTGYDASTFLKSALSIFTGNIGVYCTDCIMIVIICILLNVLKNISAGLHKPSTDKIVTLACYGVILCIVLTMTKSAITECCETISLLKKFCDIVFPLLFTVMSGMGATTSVSVYQPVMSLFSSSGIVLVEKAVIPMFYICFTFSLIGNMCPDIRLHSFVKTVKSGVTWLLGIFFGLFLTITTAKGITGAGVDSLAIRGAKYALSGYVPIVGSYLKEGFDIVTASCIVIKNALGFGSLCILLLFSLSPILKILLIKFSLQITGSVCESIDQTISSAVTQTSESLQILLAGILCCLFSVFILLLLIISSCNLGVV